MMEVRKNNILTSLSPSKKVSSIALLRNIFRHSTSKSTFVMSNKSIISDKLHVANNTFLNDVGIFLFCFDFFWGGD